MTGVATYLHDNQDRIKVAVRMAWPSVLESFFVALAGLIDSLMVSALGHQAVAAVGLTTQPKFLGMALFIAMNVSVSAIVARRRGEKDKKGANQTLLMAILITAAAGILISILCVALSDPIIRLCGSGEDTHDGAALYFRIIMGGMLFNILSLVINAAQRGAGNTKIAMKTNVTSNVVNKVAQVIYMGCLRGAGDVVFTMVASTFSVTFVRTAGSYVMGFVAGFGLLGVWMGVMGDQLSRFLLTTWRFKTGKWLGVKI